MSTMPTPSTIAPVTFVPSAVHSPPTAPLVHRFTVDEYHRLIDTGVLKATDRVELLEGVICEMMTPIGSQHGAVVELTRKALDRIIPAASSVWSQQAVTTATSEPQPDVYVARGGYRDYLEHHPGPTELLLVVEVADTSLAFDRSEKQRIYAAVGITEYWIVNLPERKLEVYRRPIAAASEQPACYESVDIFSAEQSVDVVLDGMKVGAITVRDMLP
ncbi:MAG: Uma2 family endonuclease [Planctomycetia bacterium]|nr:Uma2 family endonuclease [Planctomycetia bacterium]